METIGAPKQNWNLLTWEQMKEVSQIMAGIGEDLDKRVRVLLVLMGWEVERSEVSMPLVDKVGTMSDAELDELIGGDGAWAVMREMQDVLCGKGDVSVVVKDGKGELMRISADNLVGAALEYTKFLDKAADLRTLPIREIEIGKNTYVLPGTAMSDMTFMQFQNVQKFEERVWMLMESVRGVVFRRQTESDGTVVDGSAEGLVMRDDLSDDEQRKVQEWMKQIREMKKWFLAHVVRLKRPVKRVLGVRNRFPWMEVRVECDVRYEEAIGDEVLADMDAAPEWLYSVVEMFVQGSIAFYSGQYLQLFKKAGGGKDHKAPLIARTDTVMSLMKYQGFVRPDDVRNISVPEAFSIMNAIEEEAKAMEDAKKGRK